MAKVITRGYLLYKLRTMSLYTDTKTVTVVLVHGAIAQMIQHATTAYSQQAARYKRVPAFSSILQHSTNEEYSVHFHHFLSEFNIYLGLTPRPLGCNFLR